MEPNDLRTRDFRRILLIKLSAVGDVVHTIPVLNKLRRRYPSARIDWLITPAIADLIRHHPAVSNVVLFRREDWSRASEATQGWQAIEDSIRLSGWSKTRRVVVLRRRIKHDVALTAKNDGASTW